MAYLGQQFSQLAASDWETRAAMLHALSTRHAAGFEAANSLNRARDQLSDPALAQLALTFANLDRPTMAAEVIDLLGPRAKTEAAGPGRPTRLYWDRAGRLPFARSAAEITALVTLAYARVKPEAPPLDAAVEWLTAHRVGDGWLPHKAKGPALAALAAYYGRARGAEDRYRLTMTVNDEQVAILDVQGPAEGKTVAVPRAAIKVGQPNRIRFAMEGRGRFGYSAVLSGFTREFGPDQDRTNRVAWVDRRAYYPAAPELDGAGAFRGVLGRDQSDDLRERGHPGRPGSSGPRRAGRLPQHPLEHARVGAGLPRRAGAPAGRHDAHRGLGEYPGVLV